jgi:hypothetical protein
MLALQISKLKKIFPAGGEIFPYTMHNMCSLHWGNHRRKNTLFKLAI